MAENGGHGTATKMDVVTESWCFNERRKHCHSHQKIEAIMVTTTVNLITETISKPRPQDFEAKTAAEAVNI
jgi:hypothetical protein